jgi:hypothetical protein
MLLPAVETKHCSPSRGGVLSLWAQLTLHSMTSISALLLTRSPLQAGTLDHCKQAT